MEMIMFFPLLLLICSFSTAQLQTDSDDQIIPHGKQTEPQRREPIIAPEPKHDIHAVLREMSASLAKQGVEMRHLQRDNEAQAAELITIKAKSKVTENQVEALKRDGEGQTAKLIELELQLKQQLQVKQVAFSASLLASGKGHVGPFNAHTSLIFRHVFTNIGRAYNPNSGLFIAPVRGAYHFEFYIGTSAHRSYPAAAALIKNGEHICTAWEQQSHNYGSTANGVTLLLKIGDVVSMRQWANSRIYDDQNHYSTFSGHLLFTM